jgi:hypothetical protein
MPNFEYYDLVYGRGWEAGTWEWISGPHKAQVTNGQLGEWNTYDLADGDYTLLVVAYGQGGGRTEAKVHVHVQNLGGVPTATATPEIPVVTPTVIPFDTSTPIPTEIPTDTPTAEPTSTPTVEPTPTETPTPTATP